MNQLQPSPVSGGGFDRFGSVARLPHEEPLARDETFAFWSDVAQLRIDGDTEIGYCTVYRQNADVVRWMERHDRTPELLIPIDGPFILPVMDADGRVEAFKVKPGEAAVIGQGVWHSACLPAEGEETTYFVIFRRGTPREDVTKQDIEPVIISMTI